MISDVDEFGFASVASVIDARARDDIIAELGLVSGAGRRGVLAIPLIARLARCPELLANVRPHLDGEPIPVRGIYFDKSPEANWLVAWHQDTSIAVEARCEAPGFSAWSVKEGVPHVRPPAELLGQMLTVRIHLDNADEINGALHVISGSHKFGVLSNERIAELRATENVQCCVAATGDALLMRPLLLHASSRSTSDRHRRVLHLEYAGFQLPHGLQWHHAA